MKGSLVTFVGIEVCRDFTGSGVLAFPTAQELEVVVSRHGRHLWTWSSSLAIPAKPHAFTVAGHSCYLWRTTWNGTTSDGHRLPAADYDVAMSLATSTASGFAVSTTTTVVR